MSLCGMTSSLRVAFAVRLRREPIEPEHVENRLVEPLEPPAKPALAAYLGARYPRAPPAQPRCRRDQSGKSQAQKSGRVRRTNDRFTLKTNAPDFNVGRSAPGAVIPDRRLPKMLWSVPPEAQHGVVLAGEEGFEPSIS